MIDDIVKKRILKLSVIILIIIVLIVIANTAKKISNRNAAEFQAQKKQAEQQAESTQKDTNPEQYKQTATTDVADSNPIENYLKTYLEKIDAGDLKGAYEMLDKEYKDSFEYLEGPFIAYNKYKTGLSYLSDLISNKNEHYIYRLRILEGRGKVIDSTVAYQEKYVTIVNKGGNLSIIDRGISELRNEPKTFQNEEYGLTATIEKEMIMVDGIVYKLSLKNESKNTVEMSGDRMSFSLTNGYSSYTHTLLNGSPMDYTIKPDATVSYLLYFEHADGTEKDLLRIKLKDRAELILLE